jgi:hypothetical protein
VFRWGLIVRALLLSTTGSANLDSEVIDVPDVAASPTSVPDIMYLRVYVCPGTATCSAAGAPTLWAKVRLDTSTPRKATVLSWSVQR